MKPESTVGAVVSTRITNEGREIVLNTERGQQVIVVDAADLQDVIPGDIIRRNFRYQ